MAAHSFVSPSCCSGCDWRSENVGEVFENPESSFCSQSVTLMINSSGTSWSGDAAAGSSGCKSDLPSLNTMLMLLAS